MDEIKVKNTNVDDGKLGLLECVFILIGGMIGSAIFSLSGLTMLSAGPASILTWLIAGIIMLLYGMLACELSCRFPQSGGVYVFPRKAFGGNKGRFWAWLSCWGTIITNIIAIAFAAIYVGTYLSVAFKWAENYQILLALISIVIVWGLNTIKFKTAGILNSFIVSFLLLTIIVYVFSCFTCGNYKLGNFTPFFTQGVDGAKGFVSSIPIAIIGYSSIMAMAFMVSDVKNPEKNVPQSMFISISVVIGIYLMVIISTLGLITAKYLIDNPGMRFIPLFAACFTKMGDISWLVGVVSIASVIALMTTMMVCVSMNSRAIQATSEDGMIPSFIGKNNKNGVPSLATALTCLSSMIIACFPKITLEIVNFGAIFNVFTIAITVIALIVARKNNNVAEPVFKAPGGKFLPIVVLIILVMCNISSIIAGGVSIFIFTAIFWGIGILLYFYQKRFNKTVS